MIGASTVAVIGVLLATSFLMSGSETAYFSLQKPERERFVRGTPSQRQAVWLLERRAALLTTLLLANEIANIGMAATTSGVVAAWFPTRPWLNVVLLTPVLVLFGEITPKVLALRFRRYWAPMASWVLTAWFWLATPARVVVTGIVGGLGRVLGVEDRGESIAEEELMIYVDHGTASGELDPSERDIIEAVFEFDELTVERLMTPRPDVFSVPLTISWGELLSKCKEEELSRVPVTGAASDDVVGVLLVKDLLRFRTEPLSGPRQLRSLLLPPVFVPASKSADSMLREFLAKRFHMAFVVDEHGTLVGLVTLDDLLRELLGTDDEENEDNEIAHTRPDAMTVKASIDVEDFAEETGIRLPEGDYHTLAGFVLHQLGRLPRKGESVAYGTYEFTVARMEGRRVSEIVVISRTPAPAPHQGET
ncbi:MAG: hemolysin family protein [Myxococcota bacterium]